MLAIKTLAPKMVIFRRSVRLMGNQCEISVVGNDPVWADERIDDAINEINRVEKLLGTFSDDTPINQINRNAGSKPVKTNGEIFRLIERSLQVSDLTDGVFDISYYSEKETEGAESVKTAVRQLNYQDIELDAKQCTVFLKEKGMRISSAANSKGYAADRAKNVLQMLGVTSGVINAGGDLLTWGTDPEGNAWTIATADPGQRNLPYAGIEISNMAIATSVNSEKYTAAINKKYAGTVNAGKGFAVSGIKSVSILSTSAELADAMATPVMTIGINAGLYLINQLNQVACIIVDDHERIYTSKDVTIAN